MNNGGEGLLDIGHTTLPGAQLLTLRGATDLTTTEAVDEAFARAAR